MDALTLPTLSRAQVREVKRRLLERYGIVPLQTLEHSGRNLARLAQHMLEGDLADRPIVVLAGKGMNGAGGLAAARHLLNWGAWVQILCTDAPDLYQGVPAQQLHTLQAMGAPLAWAEEGWELPPCDLVIDAIIGVGLQGEPHGKARDLIQLANSSNALILSHDLPSGVDADSGNTFVPYVHASATLAVALPKVGLLANAASQPYGELFVGDVGVPLALLEEMGLEEIGLELPTIFGHEPIVRWEANDGMAQVVGA
jgi:NAD(P)H-hydrate epimerase